MGKGFTGRLMVVRLRVNHPRTSSECCLVAPLLIIYCGLLLSTLFLFTSSCSDREQINQTATTQYFVQDFNPAYLDVLWMIDDRSPMFKIKDHLVEQSKIFFKRLDEMSGYYQMAFVSADMQFAKGGLKPADNPVILTKNTGTIEQRATNFGNIISLIINLRTGWANKGFESTIIALRDHFKPRQGVPLVLVFLSDGDDKSATPENEDAVQYYADQFLSLKGGDKNLLRIFSVNFTKKDSLDPQSGERCTNSEFSADIDQAVFQDRYFKLAQLLGGETADLCQDFASSDKLKLGGLRLKHLSKNFRLEHKTDASRILVKIFKDEQTFDLSWTYDPNSGEVQFSEIPPEGTTVQITYYPI